MRYELACQHDDGTISRFTFEGTYLPDVLTNFKLFLMANGFVIDPYSSLQFVSDEEEFPVYSTGE
jgi:hypothetical protein